MRESEKERLENLWLRKGEKKDRRQTERSDEKAFKWITSADRKR